MQRTINGIERVAAVHLREGMVRKLDGIACAHVEELSALPGFTEAMV